MRSPTIVPVRFLPIVERELRVLVHLSRTWWRRTWTVAAVMALLAYLVLDASRWASLSQIGQSVFTALTVCGMIYVLVAGPLRTSDCLSRERREGTLGLLFLTNLSSYDVVAGKMAANSLETISRLIAALPLVSIPFLMGGLSMMQFGRVVVALLDMMFLSLAIGVCISSLCTSGRTAFGISLLLMVLLTLGVPLIGEEVFRIRLGSTARAVFYMFCPLYTMELCLDRPTLQQAWKFWLNQAGLQALGWVAVFIACWKTRGSWRDVPESTGRPKWRERLETWCKGKPSLSTARRRHWLNQNPIQWLEGRDNLQERILWALLLGSTLVCLIGYSPRHRWPDEEFVILWSLFAHWLLCLWIAIQSPRRLADDKQSGALELLLCTPLTPAIIVRGLMSVWRRRFGRVLLGLWCLDTWLVYAYYQTRGRATNFSKDDVFQLACCAAIVLPLQTWTLGRIGIYQGLVQSNSLRATFMILWKVGLLPWFIFVGCMVTVDMSRQYFRWLPRINDEFVFGAWTGSHVLVCVVFGILANRQLSRNFRTLAASGQGSTWWARFTRRLQSQGSPASTAPRAALPGL